MGEKYYTIEFEKDTEPLFKSIQKEEIDTQLPLIKIHSPKNSNNGITERFQPFKKGITETWCLI